MAKRYGLIEAGGTKFVLGVADAEGTVLADARVPTTIPADTLGAVRAWFAENAGAGFDAIGIGSFGPLQLDRNQPDYGCVVRTPKPGWSGTDLVTPFAQDFGCPVGLETDVNGAALAEARWGAGKGRGSLLYLTIGTGIGGGFVSGGRLLHGLSHPEMGHLRVPKHPADAEFAGVCPYHGDCIEGLAAGPSIIARWGVSLSQLPADHSGHGIIAFTLGRAIATLQAVLEPERIVLGGGVMGTPGLLDKVRLAAVEAGAGYFAGDPAEIVVAPGLGERSGLFGALAVAQAAEAP